MNLADSLTYVPSGIGLRWCVDQLDGWLHPRKLEPRKKNAEFAQAVSARIPDEPRSLHEIYSSLPAKFRTVQDYRNLETQLRRLARDDRITRSGSSGHCYQSKIPKL